MDMLGQRLKSLREKKGYSLRDVTNSTGISDSVLYNLENGKTNHPPAHNLKKLAELYEVSVVSLFMICGYLDDNDLLMYQQVFNNVEKLCDEEKALIQKLIQVIANKD